LKALTIVSVWPFEEPVRGRLETILIVPDNVPPAAAGEAAGLGDAAATGDGLGTAGLAGAAGLVVADVVGAAAGFDSAGFVVGLGVAPPPQAARNRLAPIAIADSRQVAIPVFIHNLRLY